MQGPSLYSLLKANLAAETNREHLCCAHAWWGKGRVWALAFTFSESHVKTFLSRSKNASGPKGQPAFGLCQARGWESSLPT